MVRLACSADSSDRRVAEAGRGPFPRLTPAARKVPSPFHR